MVVLEKPGFDAAAFLANAGLGRRVIQFASKEALFSQGDPADAVFYLQQGPRKGHSCFCQWEGSHDRAGLRGRFCGRRGSCGRTWPTFGNCYCHYRLHRSQNRAERDDPGDARGKQLFRVVLEVPAGTQHAHSGGSGRSAFQLQ